MTCHSRNLIYLVICPTFKEQLKVKSIGETKIGDSKLRDRVRIYRQHIRQSEHEKLKLEKHLRACGKGNFTKFPFLQLLSNDTDLRREYEDYLIKKFKTKLNSYRNRIAKNCQIKTYCKCQLTFELLRLKAEMVKQMT